jgi:type I restriction enzyme, S subunit
MNEQWKRHKLRQVCTLINGRAYSKPELLSEAKYPVLRVGNFFTNNHWYYSDMELDADKYCDDGDLLYAWSASFGPRIWTGGKVIFHYHIWKVQPNPALIDKDFLFAWFLWDVDRIRKDQGAGTTMIHVAKGSMEEREVLVPPLHEQRRIVGILNEAFEGIATAKANAEKNLQNARALFESHLQSVFSQRGPGWAVKTVGEIAKHSLGKMLDKAKNKGDLEPYLRNLNVRWFTFDLSDILQMPFLPSETEKYTALKGDVLVCEGGYPGRAAIWEEDYPIHFQKALHRVRFHEQEHNKWFVYYLYAQDASGELKQHFSGTGIQHFTGEVLARFGVPLPPLPELRSAVANIDELYQETQRLESIYQRKIVALEGLKMSVLHQAFAGEL